MAKKFLLRFNVNTGTSDLPFYFIDEGKSVAKMQEIHEVVHDDDGIDLDNTPIGGAEGQYTTELYGVYPITATQEKFLNKIGIH